ncbi:MAG: acyl-CoA dehydrogenase family protein [Chloroflexi bacterium]|nr:acyl-CoA dehydrogenase family protein [Chloroflexota bacterium]MBP7041202.1 acyl-CoA dehydrogenase family protein [Chloroflexota bacterium]
MNTPSPELTMILTTLREFVTEEVIPLEPLLLNHDYDQLLPQLQAKRDKAKALGLWLPQIPQEYGGMGLSLVEHGRVSEVLGRSLLGHYVFNCQAPDAGNMEILIEHGTPDQQETYLKPLLAGDIRSCFSMTEPENPGSNPTWMSTTAVKDGPDYIITGHKWFSTAADGAAFAIVMAITEPTAAKHQRASQIIVPTHLPGFRLVRNTSVMGERGLGWASHGEIMYDGVRVPQSNLLGPEGAGFMIAQERLGPGRIHHCMRWIGICERAFDLMCAHAVRREVAPGHALAEQQTIQNWVAESRAEINAARLMVLDAAQKMDEQGQYAARDEVSLIKFYVAGVLQRVLDRALQAHGALGMTDETPIAYWYRHERAARIYDGPDEVHKRAVARRILQRYN